MLEAPTLGVAEAERVPRASPASSTLREKRARRNLSFDMVFTVLPTPACPRGEKPKRVTLVTPAPIPRFPRGWFGGDHSANKITSENLH